MQECGVIIKSLLASSLIPRWSDKNFILPVQTSAYLIAFRKVNKPVEAQFGFFDLDLI